MQILVKIISIILQVWNRIGSIEINNGVIDINYITKYLFIYKI
jgi:hypothetical protein